MNCNNVVLLGRLVRKPQLRYGSGGRPNCTFQIAVNRPIAQSISPAHMENQEEQDLYVDYPWITVSEDQAEICFEKLRSGSLVLIHDAGVRTHRYEEKPRKEIKFCPHCGHSVESVEVVELTSKKFVTCTNESCKQEIVLTRTRLVTTIRAEQVEFISENEEGRVRKRVLDELKQEGRLLPEKDKLAGDKGTVSLPKNGDGNKQQNGAKPSNQHNQNNRPGNRNHHGKHPNHNQNKQRHQRAAAAK